MRCLCYEWFKIVYLLLTVVSHDDCKTRGKESVGRMSVDEGGGRVNLAADVSHQNLATAMFFNTVMLKKISLCLRGRPVSPSSGFVHSAGLSGGKVKECAVIHNGRPSAKLVEWGVDNWRGTFFLCVEN